MSQVKDDLNVVIERCKADLEAINKELTPNPHFSVIRGANYFIVAGHRAPCSQNPGCVGMPRKFNKDHTGLMHADWETATRFTEERAKDIVAKAPAEYGFSVIKVVDYLHQLKIQTEHLLEILS